MRRSARYGKPRSRSLDDLVGTTEQCERNGETERFGCGEVDYQLKLHRLLDRQIGGLGASENFAGESASLAPTGGEIGAVAHQAAGEDELTPFVDRGYYLAGRQRYDLFSLVGEKRIAIYDERARSNASQSFEGGVDLAHRARV